MRVELREDALHVSARGVDADPKVARDRCGVGSTAEKREDLELAAGERRPSRGRRPHLCLLTMELFEDRRERRASEEHPALARSSDPLEDLFHRAGFDE